MAFTKETSDKLKNEPIDVQVRSILKSFDSPTFDANRDRIFYHQFIDIIKDLKIANKVINRKVSLPPYEQKVDFYELVVDEFMRMRVK